MPLSDARGRRLNKEQQFNVWYWIVAFMLLMLFQSWWQGASITERIPYSRFLELLEGDRIAEVQVQPERIVGRYRDPIDGRTHFITNIVPDDLTRRLERSSAQYDGTVTNTFLTMLLSWVVPIMVLFALRSLFFRRFAEKRGFGCMMSVGKSKAKVYVEKDTGVTFDNVAGIDEVKAELQEIVSFLREPDKYGRLGARIPKGILLVGPPGTGKTLVARAIAGEAGVPFFSISGSEFVEMFVGVGAARVRDLFEQARKAAPCIIFIDELDALGKTCGVGVMGGGHDEKEQTLNQLLTELDGFDPREGIVLLAATNRPEILDPALLRAGRLDRQVVVDRPDKGSRAAILRVHLKKVKYEGLDVDQIAALTLGFSGAGLANMVNEAAIQATRRGRGREDGRRDRSHRTHRRGNRAQGTALEPEETRGRRLARDGPCAGRSQPARRRSGAQGFDHSALDRRPGLYHDPADRGPLPHHSGRSGKPHGSAAGRPCGRGSGAGRNLDRCGRRPCPRHRHRAPDRHPLRHASKARAGCAESAAGGLLGEDGAPGLSPRDYSKATAREVDLAVRELIEAAYDRAKQVLTDRRAELEAGTQLLLERETITPDDFPALKPMPI